ncbi:MAG: hypothetical protein ACOVK2_03965, partial [Candidatus Fonsibacter sp.]
MAIIPSDEKVFMVDKRTNTVYGGSAALQAMQQWYTMQDVIDSVRPYKVFTALLTQSGEASQACPNQGLLTIGVTYQIVFNSIGMDFTNVGSPDNNVGTYFVATSTIPTSWGSNEGQDEGTLCYNTGAPVATVLENTIGNVWFTYDGVGDYRLNSNGLFTINKTTQFLNGTLVEEGCLNVSNYTDGNLMY